MTDAPRITRGALPYCCAMKIKPAANAMGKVSPSSGFRKDMHVGRSRSPRTRGATVGPFTGSDRQRTVQCKLWFANRCCADSYIYQSQSVEKAFRGREYSAAVPKPVQGCISVAGSICSPHIQQTIGGAARRHPLPAPGFEAGTAMSRKTTPRAASNSSMGAPGLLRISASLTADLDAAFFRCGACYVRRDMLRSTARPHLLPGMKARIQMTELTAPCKPCAVQETSVALYSGKSTCRAPACLGKGQPGVQSERQGTARAGRRSWTAWSARSAASLGCASGCASRLAGAAARCTPTSTTSPRRPACRCWRQPRPRQARAGKCLHT